MRYFLVFTTTVGIRGCLAVFHGWGNTGVESNLLKALLLVNGGARIKTQVSLSPKCHHSSTFPISFPLFSFIPSFLLPSPPTQFLLWSLCPRLVLERSLKTYRFFLWPTCNARWGDYSNVWIRQASAPLSESQNLVPGEELKRMEN